MSTVVSKCETISTEIAEYLKKYIESNKGFVIRSFYGESFALSLLASKNILDSNVFNILIEEYQKKNKLDPEFHWEFNNYAFLNFLKRHNDEKIKSLVFPLSFKGTKCTNWTLLRSVSSIMGKYQNSEAVLEAKEKILKYQKKSGQILDDLGVSSFQYHCFSAAMIYELYELTNDVEFLNSFELAVAFISNFILPNGQSLYIGRGQEQSFGIGALIYILAIRLKLKHSDEVYSQLCAVVSFLEKHQRSNGSFPLVLTGIEPLAPEDVKVKDSRFAGWYPYNNFFDYLPFMGFFIDKAVSVLNSLPIKDISFNFTQRNYSDDQFLKIVNDKYIAVLAKPGGYWSNDLFLPLIYTKDKLLTPLIGGEQFQDSIYSDEMLSFPIILNSKIRFRKYGVSFFWGDVILWLSPFGIVCRKYRFESNFIKINTTILSIFKSFNTYMFNHELVQVDKYKLISSDLVVKSNSPLSFYKKGYSASGESKVYVSDKNAEIIMEIL